MTKIVCRNATAVDIAALLPLQKEIHDCHVAHHPEAFHTAAPDEVTPLLQQWFADPNFRCIIAFDGAAAVGYVFAWLAERQRNALCNGRRFITLDQLCVRSTRRRSGVGRALTNAVYALAGENGIQDIQLSVWSDNDDAKAFYRKLGFRVFTENYRYRVEQPASHVPFAPSR